MYMHGYEYFFTLICVNWTRTENKERNERELIMMVSVVVLLVNHLNDKKQDYVSMTNQYKILHNCA